MDGDEDAMDLPEPSDHPSDMARTVRALPRTPITGHFDGRYRRMAAGPLAGVDEAGRGPLAGPVVAAAVILPAGRPIAGLEDSKLLDEADRERLFAEILARAAVSVAFASAARIDAMNIRAASLWAMREAVLGLPRPPDLVVVDGDACPPGLACPAEAIVGGDGRSASIAAASIVAKVLRDRHMVRLCRRDPRYGFSRHKGYATEEHRAALLRHGPMDAHRRSFAPVRAALGEDPIRRLAGA